MILNRRIPLSRLQRLNGWLWPRRGWQRAGRYLLMRLQRMPGTPHSIAAGCAAGTAVSFTPFLGGHILLAFALAYLTRGNMLAAALGTIVGNPWTFPLILTTTYQLGCLILGQPPQRLRDLAPFELNTLLDQVGVLLWPMTVGSVPLGIAAWIASYVLLARAVRTFQERRRQRLAGAAQCKGERRR